MAHPVRLACPLCGEVVIDGGEPGPGRCPRCGSGYIGGHDSVDGASEAALTSLHLDPEGAAALSRTLFERDPDELRSWGIAITSDHRDGFYGWWIFLPASDADARACLEALAS